MGLWDVVRGELIDIISWLDDSGDVMVWRFPDNDNEIKMGAKLTVREGQAAVFVNEGTIADVFMPGMYTLTTQNMPVMTTLRSWKYGFESPFKAEVYFVGTRNFIDLKWGTQNPIMMRDCDFGVVRLRAFGTYGIKITNPGVFIRQIVGTNGCYTTEEIEGQLRSILVSAFTGMLAGSEVAALDLAANYNKISERARSDMDTDFSNYGLSLTRFVIENISVPPEVEKMLDTRAQMGIVGDMGKFTQFQTANSIPDAAKSGGAGEFMGMGAGIAMGKQMADAMTAGMGAAGGNQSKPTTESKGKFCGQCGIQISEGAKFCPECGAAQQGSCPKCGQKAGASDKFCKECGEKLKND